MTQQQFPSDLHLQHLEKLHNLLKFAVNQVYLAGEALPRDKSFIVNQRFSILSLTVKQAAKAWELYAACLEEVVIQQQEEETSTTRKEEESL